MTSRAQPWHPGQGVWCTPASLPPVTVPGPPLPCPCLLVCAMETTAPAPRVFVLQTDWSLERTWEDKTLQVKNTVIQFRMSEALLLHQE